MSEPTITNSSASNAPQFLGPQDSPRADEDHGTEIHRYFSTKYRGLLSVRSNGVTLFRGLGDASWRVLLRKKPDMPLDDWLQIKRNAYTQLAPWKRNVDDLPTMDEVSEWVHDSVCETPTGHRVEPDGVGPDGVPSWLGALGLI